MERIITSSILPLSFLTAFRVVLSQPQIGRSGSMPQLFGRDHFEPSGSPKALTKVT